MRPLPSSLICTAARNTRAAGSRLDIQILMHGLDSGDLRGCGGPKRQADQRCNQQALHRCGGNRATRSSDSLPRLTVIGSQVPGACCRTTAITSPAWHRYTGNHDDHIARVHARALRDAVLGYVANDHAAAAAVEHHPQAGPGWCGGRGLQAEHCVRDTQCERIAVPVRIPGQQDSGLRNAQIAQLMRYAETVLQVSAAHDAHDQGRRRAGAPLRDGLRHRAVPQLHAFDEAHECRIDEIGFGSTARRVPLRQVLE